MRDETVIVHSGRHPEEHHGAVNPPVFHASTILAGSAQEYLARRRAWLEDVPPIARATHDRGATVIMDNTWATPLYFKPFAHGVDVSVHAATKYIVGHSDAMLGVVTCTRDAWPRLRTATYELGQTAGPDVVYLAQRGLRTLAVRMKQHWATAMALAQWIAKQPEVQR